uniref:Uncharacterized protein n=1 Tax=Acrobeloides nanus TaxID=290746 RepID=A0A914CPW1_9BILA
MAEDALYNMAAEERRMELERKKQKLAEMRMDKERRKQEKLRHTLVPGEINGSTTDSGRQSLPNFDMEEILGSVGIPSAVNIENGSHPPKTNDVSHETSPNRILRPNRLPNLEIAEIQTVSIAPKNGMSYSKTTQTDDERISVGEFSLGSQEFDFDEISVGEKNIDINFDESPTHEIAKLLPNLQFGHKHVDEKTEKEIEIQARIPDLSEEEKRQLLTSNPFVQFFQRSAKVIERALNEDVDIFVDYSRDFLAEQNAGDGELLTLNREFIDEKSCANRFVTALDFSSFFPELVAVAYDHNPNAPLDPPGIVNVWSTRHKTLEGTFHSTSRLTSMLYAKFHANIIVGGCYSGQICMWDNRVNKKTPVHKSPLSTAAHTQPVFCMKMVGTQNAHDLVTVSTDGKMCTWSVDNLNAPIDTVTLCCKTKRQLPTLCLSFFHNNITSFCAGGEDGFLYVGDRHGNKGEVAKFYQAHYAPVSTVDMHKTPGKIDYSSLCLSGSLDWSLKLWNLRENSPLLSFEKHKHYVLDVQWSPVHPAVFISSDSDGNAHLWNINADTESPISSLNIGGGRSARKMMWSKDGKQLIIGDDNGRILLYDVHESLYNVRSDEWDKLSSTLKESRLANADNDDRTETAPV